MSFVVKNVRLSNGSIYATESNADELNGLDLQTILNGLCVHVCV